MFFSLFKVELKAFNAAQFACVRRKIKTVEVIKVLFRAVLSTPDVADNRLEIKCRLHEIAVIYAKTKKKKKRKATISGADTTIDFNVALLLLLLLCTWLLQCMLGMLYRLRAVADPGVYEFLCCETKDFKNPEKIFDTQIL